MGIRGMEADAGGMMLTHSTLASGLLAVTILSIAFAWPYLSVAFVSFWHELWSVRQRRNVFDEVPGASIPATVMLFAIFAVYGGIILYFVPGLPPSLNLYGIGAAMLLLTAFVLFQYITYRMVAYAFAGPVEGRKWINGYVASQAFASILIVPVAVLLLLHPEWHKVLVSIALCVYIIFHLLFIVKGFRIFYSNFLSLLYFILYLCSLEIIPILALFHLTEILWGVTAL